MFAIDVLQGMELPRWYAVAWHDYSRNVAVCYPIGIHLLVGWPRLVWKWLRFRSVPTRWDTLRQAYEAGHLAGRQYELSQMHG